MRRSVLRSLGVGGQRNYSLSMYHVYVIHSQKDGSYYTGFTENIEKRLQDHNQRTVKATKSKASYDLVWHCVFNNKNQALDFEKYLKSRSGITFRTKRLI